ncbi:MAG: hypothetical protein NT120_04700 [Candidatus Aenigmarchaeota archaeon]|nr:hypothetical protein [Candidatus Aenigmarchaeota archaeon]
MKAEIVFADEKLKQAFNKLKDSKTEERQLYDLLTRAFEDIKNNPSGFIHVPRNLIPKEYKKKYSIDNLWKYDLPNGWRLLYSLSKDKVLLLAIILEWLDHRNYEKRFKY